MALKLGKRELAKIVTALDAEHETVEDAAAAVMEAAEEIFEQRAKFVVVGQLARTKAEGTIQPSDPRAIKVSLGWYSTEAEAHSAAGSLYHSTQSGDEFRTWVLPVHHGTPATLHAKRKAEIQAAQERLNERRDAEFRKSIKQHEEEKWREAGYL